MSRVAILCPTKARPTLFARLVDKVQETTDGRVTILAYLEDTEDNNAYPKSDRVIYHSGRNQSVNTAMNHLVHRERDFTIYGMIPDDAYPTIKDWDLYLGEVLDPTLARAMVTPHDFNYVDMAFVTRAWTDAVGFYAAPFARHYVWPTVIDILAEATNKHVTPDPTRLMVHHDHVAGGNISLKEDAEAFLHWCGFTRPSLVARLRGLP